MLNSCWSIFYNTYRFDCVCIHIIFGQISSESIDHDVWSQWRSIQQNLSQCLWRFGKLDGPECRNEHTMDIFLLPFIFSVWAAISFLLLLQAIMTRHNVIWSVEFMILFFFQIVQELFQWMSFSIWAYLSSYSGCFWWSIFALDFHCANSVIHFLLWGIKLWS